MVPIDLCDTITIEKAKVFSFSCSDASLQNHDNLVMRAVRAATANANVSVALEKRIPSQAGLGGGSSDAASILLAAMNGAFGAIPERDWVSIARELGSDVPFFLAQSGALVEGTGERVTSVGALPPWHVLVVKPPCAVATGAAFAELDRGSRPSRPRSSSISLDALEALQRGDFDGVARTLSNDFHDVMASRYPEIARALAALSDAGATRPLLSGSGSAAFALEPTREKVLEIEGRLSLPDSFQIFSARLRDSHVWRK